MGDLDGKVAIVTGAARGLGRQEALQLASQGARVVVNDLGTKPDGTGRDEEPARAVCEEIRKLGSEAVPHFGDAADWDDARALIAAALEEFGDLHVLVNNAGFIRDAMPWNMTEKDFDDVVRVHLKGHFCPMRFAMTHWREDGKRRGEALYGRILSTASEAWLFGNPGQFNYAAAKAGVVSMTMGAAQLMWKYGVTANVFVPRARTRMNEEGPYAAIFQKPEEGFDTFAPENATPLVGYLASPRAERISGHVFIVWGTELKVLGRPEPMAQFSNDGRWTSDALHAKLEPFFEKLEPVKDGYSVPPI